MPADYAKVKKIFLDALQVPLAQDRQGYIEEVCGTDIELRNFVFGMLDAHHQHATPIPEGPTRADPQVHGIPGSIPPGTVLADKYKIIEQIAQGGMGSVYRASRITDLKMEVAIKVIRPGMGSEQVLARFNIERQALAIMKHENIARVYDAGTTAEGLPFFVMELVKGLSLTRFCDDSKLSVPERLELFEQICSAVQHAHQKGIVHRDLKPSNILVALYDDKPVPKVIDFGLAKALHQPLTDDILHTTFGTFVGTWQYTAPEQAQLNNLDIDTRADIYSLGVILYELLTGNTPVDKHRLTNAAIQEVLRMIREEEPPRPSTKIHSSDQLPNIAALRSSEPLKLERMVRGELDWIVMKALEKDRNRRYATANELAADLQRYRHHEPVQAGPPTFSYRAGKYLRKHRGKALVAALFVAAISVGAVVSFIGWRQAVQERQRADTQTEIAVAVNDFLRELLSEADPAVQIRPDQKFVSDITVKKALDRAAEKVGARFGDKPLIEAAVRHTMGKTYLGLGDLPNARIQFEKAEQLRLKHASENDPQRLESLYELGWLALQETKYPQSESILKQVIELREKTLGNTHADTLRAKYAYALLLEYQDKVVEAKALFEQVLALQKQYLGAEHRDTLTTQRSLAEILDSQGDLGGAEKHLSDVLVIQRGTLGLEHPDTLITRNSLAQNIEKKAGLKQGEEKKGVLKQAEAIYLDLVTISKNTLDAQHPVTLSYQCNLAANHVLQERFTEAIGEYQKLIPAMKQVIGATAYDCIAAIQNCAAAMIMNHQPKQAERLLLDALQSCRSTLGIEHEKTQLVLQNIIEMYRSMNEPEKVKEYEQLLNKNKK